MSDNAALSLYNVSFLFFPLVFEGKLSLNELNIIRECFIKDLVNFNHGRIAYNKENKNDQTEQSVVLPEPEGSAKE